MKRNGLLDPLFAAFRGEQFKCTAILIVSPLLLITWWYFGSAEFYMEHLSERVALWPGPGAAAAVYKFVACFVLLGLIPALIVKLVLRERLADYGVQLGDRARTLRSFLLLAPIILLIAFVASHGPAMLAEYPTNKSAGTSPGMFGFHACTYLLFYLGWEFHFRGFLQYGLRSSLGEVNAILIQVSSSVLLHIGKPTAETYAAVLGGLLWGMLAFRTRSLLSGLLQHYLLGISLDWFICYA